MLGTDDWECRTISCQLDLIVLQSQSLYITEKSVNVVGDELGLITRAFATASLLSKVTQYRYRKRKIALSVFADYDDTSTGVALGRSLIVLPSLSIRLTQS